MSNDTKCQITRNPVETISFSICEISDLSLALGLNSDRAASSTKGHQFEFLDFPPAHLIIVKERI